MVSSPMLRDRQQAVDIQSSSSLVTVFVCANCARECRPAESALRARPAVPDLGLPAAFQQVLLPCTGRLQPEHVLKAFESGARLVCAVACREDNCHYLEGSKRCARRVEYLRGLLDEIGLGADRLLLFHLPGTAAEDMYLAAGRPASALGDVDAQVASIRESVLRALETLTPTPLDIRVSEAAEDPYQQVDTSYDDNEE